MHIDITAHLRRRDVGRAVLAVCAWATGLGSTAWAQIPLPKEV